MQAFIATAETYSITQAARLMDISPPAISKHIRNLEQNCENELFSLSGKTLYLTNFGEQLFALVKPFMNSAEILEHNILKIKQNDAPPIKLLTTSTILALVSKKIIEFRKIYPHIDFELSTIQWKHQHDSLVNSSHDIYLLSEPRSFPKRIESNIIGDYNMVMVAPQNHPFQNKPVSMEQLNDVTFITTDDESASQLFQNQLFKQWKGMNKPLKLDSYAAVKDCIIADVGIGILPAAVVQDDIDQGRLCAVNFPLNSPIYNIILAHKRELNEQMELFYNYICKHPI